MARVSQRRPACAGNKAFCARRTRPVCATRDGDDLRHAVALAGIRICRSRTLFNAPVGLVAITMLTAAVLTYVGRDRSGKNGSGPYAEFTRSQLSQLVAAGSKRNPVLLPLTLPQGVGDPENNDFVLLNKPVTDDRRRHAGEVWLSTYVVGALPPTTGNISGYSVYQEWQQTPGQHRPRCTGNQTVVRQVGNDVLTICLGPSPTLTSRDYWSTVEFTSDLRRVEWLRDRHS